MSECDGNFAKADDRLSRYTDAIGYCRTELIQMLEVFPNKEDWKGGQIRRLKDEAYRQMTKRREKAALASEEPRKSQLSPPVSGISKQPTIIAATTPASVSPKNSSAYVLPPAPPAVQRQSSPPKFIPPLPSPVPQSIKRPSGMHMVYVNQLITLIETNSLDLENDELMLRLQVLHAQLENLFVTVQK